MTSITTTKPNRDPTLQLSGGTDGIHPPRVSMIAPPLAWGSDDLAEPFPHPKTQFHTHKSLVKQYVIPDDMAILMAIKNEKKFMINTFGHSELFRVGDVVMWLPSQPLTPAIPVVIVDRFCEQGSWSYTTGGIPRGTVDVIGSTTNPRILYTLWSPRVLGFQTQAIKNLRPALIDQSAELISIVQLTRALEVDPTKDTV